jgi:deazaflavin-dependent oxidoreductase (nitroreductase family)
MKRFGHTRTARVLFRRTVPVLDRIASKISGGRFTFSGIVVPALILEHQGRRSSRLYNTPLAYVPLGDAFVVAGSNWGRADHPAWSSNLLARPDATIVAAGETIPVHARLATSQERQELWPLLISSWPAFETYAVRAADREIRVFILDRSEP